MDYDTLMNSLKNDLKDALKNNMFGSELKKQSMKEIQEIFIKDTEDYLNIVYGDNHIKINPLEANEETRIFEFELIGLDCIGKALIKQMEEK